MRRLNLTRRFVQWLRPGWRGSLARMVDEVAYVSPAGSFRPAVTPPRLPASPQSATATDPDHPSTEERR